MAYNLTGRKVLVTGGARGIGAAIVQRFATEGCDVAINYFSSSKGAEDLAEQIRSQHHINAITVQGDMSKVQDCKKLVRESIEKLGGLDIIVSNAGNTKFAPMDDLYALEEEDWDHTWNVLCKSNVFLLQEALQTFNQNEDGGVFLIEDSLAGLTIEGSSMAYGVLRTAALKLMQTLAQTQGPKVRVNAVCPGFVATQRTTQYSAERLQGYRENAALKRVTTVEEVADVFVFLAKNRAITGEHIRVDSGLSIV